MFPGLGLALSLLMLGGDFVPVTLNIEPTLALGYDSDLYLDAAALPVNGERRSGGVVQFSPAMSLAVGRIGEHRAGLSSRLTLRQLVLSDQPETRIQHRTAVTYSSPRVLGVRAEISAALHQLLFRELDDGGWLAAEFALSLDRPLTSSLRGSLAYGVDITAYGSLGANTRELMHHWATGLTWRAAAGFLLTPVYAFATASAQTETNDWRRHRAGLVIDYAPTPALRAQAGYQLALVDSQNLVENAGGQVQDQSRRDRIHWARASIVWQLQSWLGIEVSYEALHGDSDAGFDYTRHTVLLSSSLAWRPVIRRAPRRSPKPKPGLTRWTVDRPRAKRVALVGTFNDWDPARGTMHRIRAKWQLELRLAPGDYRYMLWIDGNIVAPPGCRSWVADGFGGRSCRLVVPAQSAQ